MPTQSFFPLYSILSALNIAGDIIKLKGPWGRGKRRMY
ncbi:hypothetical protein APHCRT_0823 [Anaplasma phagocytophilum str. CRT53-1]|uniref:Uncharacterized protein n=1 Tax=Anaplasma phagocytophilum str. CRT53-1 TaxID=1359157 RepID=A0A0F3Q1D9_ANAPH|nr:hypothetical protein APHCRT_1634 [Anaplasma phagocytophilum str. CRT53-1]KJV85966.1 hypothetical protein APHCRT_0823 [Anaplasma phagocytophilum str. CRT53-1]